MKEKWVDLDFIPGTYEISNKGKVRNKVTGLILKTGIDRYGYEKINLSIKGKKYYTTIHRLVARAFLPAIPDKTQVNHKDGNKLNNHVDNLEWVNAKENVGHSYEKLLNGNTSHARLTDLSTNMVIVFKSVKSLAKFINIRASTLYPLIKYSRLNPILDKYIVEILNPELMEKRSNTVNFGRTIFCYDYLSGKTTEYPSVVLVCYRTCVRGLQCDNIKPHYYNNLGYSFSYTKETLVKDFVLSKEQIINNRRKYVLTPYKPYDNIYKLFDYYTKTEFVFDSLDDVVEFLNENLEDGIPFVKKQDVSTAISAGLMSNRTGLIRGYGIKFDNYSGDYFPYLENVVICNKYKKCIVPVFKVINRDDTKLLFGRIGLISYFKAIDLNIKMSTDEMLNIIRQCNIPNITITCLDKPMLVNN